MKKDIDWNAVFPKESATFSSRIEYILSDLKEEKEMKKVMRPLAVALVLMLLIAGTALAVANTNALVDFFHGMSGLEPAENAAESISEALGTIKTDDVILTVRSAVYDGRCVRMLIAVEAADPEHAIPVQDPDWEDEPMNNAEQETVAEYAARVGKRTVDVGLVTPTVENVSSFSESGVFDRENETLLLYFEETLSRDTPETAKMTVSVDNGKAVRDLQFELPLVHDTAVHYTFEQPENSRFTVLDVMCEHTLFADYCTVAYIAQKPDADVVPDADTVYYGTPRGVYAHTDSTCCGMMDAVVYSAEEIMDEGRELCPVCCGDAAAMALNIWGWQLTGTDLTVSYTAQGGLVSGATVNGADADSWGGSYQADVYGAEAKSATVLLQAGTFPQGDLVLTPVAPDGEVLEPILLKAAE